MRVVLFTGLANPTGSPWWPVLLNTANVESILVCRYARRLTFAQVARRFWRNVKRHGVIFIPYRIGVLVVAGMRRALSRRVERPSPRAVPVPVEQMVTDDLHAPATLDRVRAFRADIGLSIGTPLLRPSLFALPRLGTVNVHLGKVPDFRGAPPAFWELVNGSPTIGATVHWMDEGLDTGHVVAAAEALIYPDDTLHAVDARATELGTLVLREALEAIARGNARSTPQPAGGRLHRTPTLGQRIVLAWKLRVRRLRRTMAPRLVVKRGLLLLALYVYRPARDLSRRIRRRQPVRIFNFHRVTHLCRDGMTVNPEAFERRVRYLVRHHDIVPLERGLELIRTGARLSRPAAVITFDDGYRSVFHAARPILAALKVPATCFISTALVGSDRRFEHDSGNPVKQYLDVMTWEELAALRDEGWSMGTHTANHVRLSACTGALLEREIEEPRRQLKDRLGIPAPVLAYPFGMAEDISPQALDVARAHHSTILSNYDGETQTGTQALVVGRYDIGGETAPLAWKAFAHGISFGRWRHWWPR